MAGGGAGRRGAAARRRIALRTAGVGAADAGIYLTAHVVADLAGAFSGSWPARASTCARPSARSHASPPPAPWARPWGIRGAAVGPPGRRDRPAALAVLATAGAAMPRRCSCRGRATPARPRSVVAGAAATAAREDRMWAGPSSSGGAVSAVTIAAPLYARALDEAYPAMRRDRGPNGVWPRRQRGHGARPGDAGPAHAGALRRSHDDDRLSAGHGGGVRRPGGALRAGDRGDGALRHHHPAQGSAGSVRGRAAGGAAAGASGTGAALGQRARRAAGHGGGRRGAARVARPASAAQAAPGWCDRRAGGGDPVAEQSYLGALRLRLRKVAASSASASAASSAPSETCARCWDRAGADDPALPAKLETLLRMQREPRGAAPEANRARRAGMADAPPGGHRRRRLGEALRLRRRREASRASSSRRGCAPCGTVPFASGSSRTRWWSSTPCG